MPTEPTEGAGSPGAACKPPNMSTNTNSGPLKEQFMLLNSRAISLVSPPSSFYNLILGCIRQAWCSFVLPKGLKKELTSEKSKTVSPDLPAHVVSVTVVQIRQKEEASKYTG